MKPHYIPAPIAKYLADIEARLIDRIWEQVDKNGPDGCWIWTGTKDEFGYGRIRIGRVAPRLHRVVYEMFKGPIDEGLIVRHQCDVPSCVNPDHLLVGTKKQNAEDRDTRGRSGTVGTKNKRSKLTEDQVREIRNRWTGTWGQATALCREFGIKAPALYAIIRGTGWKHVT